MTSPRILPSIEQLLRREESRALEARFGRDALVEALRAEAAALRAKVAGAQQVGTHEREDVPCDRDEAARAIVAEAASRLGRDLVPSLRPVINATGVIIHTNLGRAPLGVTAIERIATLAGGYSNLEYDLDAGTRGRRDVHAEALLARLTGAQAAVVVNNNAAATLLILAALARGREVVVSRGELVEIGGGFRVPDVMAQSGAILREVGTTNRTRVSDYAAAISERTALLLRVHPSNFRIEGFTERPDVASLAAIAHDHGLPLAEDLGSGYVRTGSDSHAPERPAASGSSRIRPDTAVAGALEDEPSVRDSLDAGADILCFSGDKLLGGPQAGIVVGHRDLVERVRRHPLMRALRVDKLTYAALESTLLAWVTARADAEVPVARMMHLSVDAIRTRAERLAGTLTRESRLRVSLEPGSSTIGGGSAPGSSLPTMLLAIEVKGETPTSLEERLRALPVPVIARVERDRVVLDLRTVTEDEEHVLVEQLRRV